MTADLIARARALLAAATPGPYEAQVIDEGTELERYEVTGPMRKGPPPTRGMFMPVVCQATYPADAALIAAAPALIAELCDALALRDLRLERLDRHLACTANTARSEIKLKSKVISDFARRQESLISERHEARAEIERLREAAVPAPIPPATMAVVDAVHLLAAKDAEIDRLTRALVGMSELRGELDDLTHERDRLRVECKDLVKERELAEERAAFAIERLCAEIELKSKIIVDFGRRQASLIAELIELQAEIERLREAAVPAPLPPGIAALVDTVHLIGAKNAEIERLRDELSWLRSELAEYKADDEWMNAAIDDELAEVLKRGASGPKEDL